MSDHQRNNKAPGSRKGKKQEHIKPQSQQQPQHSTSTVQQEQQLPLEQPHPPGVAACLVCYAPLTHPGITSCDHNEICALCHLRLRFLHQDMKCPICKNPNELVIVDSFYNDHTNDNNNNDEPPRIKLFSEYPTAWGDDEDHLYMGDNYVYRGDSVKIFFEKEYYETEVVPLFGFKCHNCHDYGSSNDEPRVVDGNKKTTTSTTSGVKTSVRALQEHLKSQHGLSLCQLCIDHKRDFVAKLPRFTPAALQQHLRNGDGPHSGFSGHPLCEFCKPTRFYDSSELFRHLQKDHYKCHVCEQQGLDHQYFRDYSSLAKHFERMHFLCPHASCMEIRFVVFSNELDLRKHLREIHGEAGGDTKLQLEFRYKSSRHVEDQSVPTAQDFQYGLDGQAFVPEALVAGNNSLLPNNPTGIGMHPMHMERTAQLRAQAAQVRQAQDAATAFPSLQETVDTTTTNAPSGGPLQVGWTSSSTLQRVARHGNHGAVTEEDFPSLPAASRAPMVQRQFAAIQSAASNPHAATTNNTTASMPNWNSSSAATAAAFPSLPTRTASTLDSSAARAVQAIPNNRLENLAPDNFPALAAPSRSKATAKLRPGGQAAGGTKYNAAEELAARLRRQTLNTETASFPPFGRAVASQEAAPSQPARKATPPSIQDTNAFPPPPAPSNTYPALRIKAGTTTGSNLSNGAALGNVLQVPATSAASLQQGEATVEDMKATLGTAKYKKLKSLTKEFASDQLSPQSFCDQAAALFDRGVADPDYLRYIPLILSSFPNTIYAQQALRYIKEMRVKSKSQTSTATATTTPSVAAPPVWTAPPPAVTTPIVEPMLPPTFSSFASTAAYTNHSRPMTATTAVSNAYPPGFGKKAAPVKTAWGSGTPTAVLATAKVPPQASVAMAAAQEGPQTGTATKYMAKQQKLQNVSSNNNTLAVASKKKKKEKDELRALAFGK